jgi:hypothetical protein
MPISPTTCEPVRVEACRDFVIQAKGDRTFRPENVEGCLKQVDETFKKALIKAEDMVALRAKCSRVYEGRAKANEVCAIDQDCQSPLICDKGHCGPLRTVSAGANCANPGEICQSTEYCRPTSGLLVCTKRPGKDAACSEAEPCGPGLRCQNVCIEKLANGTACSRDEECAEGFCHPFPPPGTPNICAGGLSFAQFTPVCDAYFPKAP